MKARSLKILRPCGLSIVMDEKKMNTLAVAMQIIGSDATWLRI